MGMSILQFPGRGIHLFCWPSEGLETTFCLNPSSCGSLPCRTHRAGGLWIDRVRTVTDFCSLPEDLQCWTPATAWVGFSVGSSAAVGGEFPQLWVVIWLDVLWRILWRIRRVLDIPALEMWECELRPAEEGKLRAKDALLWGAEAHLLALVYWEWFCGLESSNWPVVCGISVLCHGISAVPPLPLMPQGAVGGFGSWTFLSFLCLGYTALFQRFHASLVCVRECTYIYIPSWGTLKNNPFRNQVSLSLLASG